MAERDRDTEGLLVQICLECGKEYMFEDESPPEGMTCDKCGNTVFRSYLAETQTSDALDDFRESTERDVLTTDAATDVTRGDLHDLNNL